MRSIGFALAGLILGAGIAVALALPQSPVSRAVDTQGLHLMGVLFVAAPVGGILGAALGVVLARLTKR